MSKAELDRLIGHENTKNVTEMGGVVSIVITRGANAVALGHLTPEEGIEVFQWGVHKEAEIASKTEPKAWAQIKRDSMGGELFCDLGEEWFKDYVNQRALGIQNVPPYI